MIQTSPLECAIVTDPNADFNRRRLTPDTELYALGDNCFIVRFDAAINELTRQRINGFTTRLTGFINAAPALSCVVECVPSFVTVALFYDIAAAVRLTAQHGLLIDYFALHLRALLESTDAPPNVQPSRVVTIPVCYADEFAPDLERVAAHHRLPKQEVIARHTAATYTVYAIGFAPGFAYLGGLPECLHTPRLEQPRLHVAAGSVGIGGAQTGVYPHASPGGWNIIGRTALTLFDFEHRPPAVLQPGDTVRFETVDSKATG